MGRTKVLLLATLCSTAIGAIFIHTAHSVNRPKAANVAESRIIAADQEPGNWMTHGRTYNEQRFSPLKQINDQNVSRLGLACFKTSSGSTGIPR